MLLRRITVGKVSVLLKSILLIAVIFSSGGGSALIQTFAWATMLPSQISQSSSVEEGISNTFDGDHPCGLCKIAEHIRENEAGEPAPKGGEQKQVSKKVTETWFLVACLQPRFSEVSREGFGNTTPDQLGNIVYLGVSTPPPQWV